MANSFNCLRFNRTDKAISTIVLIALFCLWGRLGNAQTPKADTLNSLRLTEQGARRAIQTVYDLDICRKIDREKSSIIIEHSSKIILLERRITEMNAGYIADREIYRAENQKLEAKNIHLENKVKLRGKVMNVSLAVNAVLIAVGYFILR